MLREGGRVSYTGLPAGELAFEDEGKILALSGQCAHVQWATGRLVGEVSLVDALFLAPAGGRPLAVEAGLDDSLEVAGLGEFTARQIYDEEGGEGLLNAMVESGHLAVFSSIAEEALELVSGRIRTSPDFLAITGHLDETEAEEMVRIASAALIRDAFTPD